MFTSGLQLTYCGFLRRGLAAILDTMILLAAGYSLFGLPYGSDLGMLTLERWGTFSVVGFIYFAGLEWLTAGTIGKLLAGIRVVGVDGSKCSLRAALIRNILRVVDFLPAFYLLGILLMSRSNRKQRLGDKIAETIVARSPVPKPTPPPAPFLFH